MANENSNEDPKSLDDALSDIDQVINAAPDPQRVEDIRRTNLLNEIAALQEERAEVIAAIVSGENSQENLESLRVLEQSLQEAHAEELTTRADPNTSGNQEGNGIIS